MRLVIKIIDVSDSVDRWYYATVCGSPTYTRRISDAKKFTSYNYAWRVTGMLYDRNIGSEIQVIDK